MTYSIEKIDSINQADFDALWEDCKTIIETETFPFSGGVQTKETIFSLINSLDIAFKVQKDGKDIAVKAGWKENNKLNIGPVLFGNNSEGSKAYIYDSDYWTVIKDFTISIGCAAYGGEVVKNSSVENWFTSVGNNLIYPNATLEKETDRVQGSIVSRTIWLNHS